MTSLKPRPPHAGASVSHMINFRHEAPHAGTASLPTFSFSPSNSTPLAAADPRSLRSIDLRSPSAVPAKPAPDMPSSATPSASPPILNEDIKRAYSQMQPPQSPAMPQEEKKMPATSSSPLPPTRSPPSASSPAPLPPRPPIAAQYPSSRFQALRSEDEMSVKSEHHETASQAAAEEPQEQQEPKASRPMTASDIERDKEFAGRLIELQEGGVKLTDGFVIKTATLEEKEEEFYRAQSRMELTDHENHFHLKIKNFAKCFSMASVVLDLGLEFIGQQIHDKVNNGEYKSVIRRHHQKYGSRPLGDPLQDMIYMTLDPILTNPFVPLIILGKLIQLFQGKATLNIPGLGGATGFRMPTPNPMMWSQQPQPYPAYPYGYPPYPYPQQQQQYPYYGQQPPQQPPQYPYYGGQQQQSQSPFPTQAPPQVQPQQQPRNPFATSAPQQQPAPTKAVPPSSSSSIPGPTQSAADLQGLDVVWRALPYLESNGQSAQEQERLNKQHQLASRRPISNPVA